MQAAGRTSHIVLTHLFLARPMIKAEAAAADNWLLLLFLSQCANGVTTPDVASTSETACKIVQPSFAPTSVGDGIVKSTQNCPQK